jgi:hypothetical protein
MKNLTAITTLRVIDAAPEAALGVSVGFTLLGLRCRCSFLEVHSHT